MEFHEKLQELRKQKGLTQEELAASLFVSRAAISKWESGRGYPSIDSLKAIAQFFSVSIDALLSSEEVLSLAETDTKEKQQHLRSLVWGLLDCSLAMFFLLPFFRQTHEETIQAVSLLGLGGIAPYLKVVYLLFTAGVAGFGLLTLAFQNHLPRFWNSLSMVWNGAGVLLFILGLQPYAAAFLFLFLIIKVLMLVKGP